MLGSLEKTLSASTLNMRIPSMHSTPTDCPYNMFAMDSVTLGFAKKLMT